MNELLKRILQSQGWYFTPPSVIAFLRKEKAIEKPKLEVVFGNPPYKVNIANSDK